MSFPEYARAVARKWPGRSAGLVVLKQPTSTHLLARRIVEEYSAESAQAPPSDFLAWHQTEGRGRREGRSWSSPAGGGVYATLIRSLAATTLQTLPLLVAVALCEALNTQLAGRCRLKWPNDLWVAGRKLAGILIDATSRGQGEGERLAVISFGVNHGRRLDQAGATSMEIEAPGGKPLPELAAQLVEAVDRALADPPPADEIIARYRKLSLHRAGDVLRCRVGEEEIEGVFEGFDRRGFLRLVVDGEERLVTAGEVRSEG